MQESPETAVPSRQIVTHRKLDWFHRVSSFSIVCCKFGASVVFSMLF